VVTIQNSKAAHILIVEDNDDLREIYSQSLIYAGFKVLEANNGLAALNLLRSLPEKPNFILLDLMMPVMNGWQFIQERAQDDQLAKIPVVICSAASDNIPTGFPVQTKPISLKYLITLTEQYIKTG
jgi:CheY-like chemotaxis protein